MYPAQDHKRVFDGDLGLNTGGMGCYAPTRIAPPSILKEIDERILQPTFQGLKRKEGILFVGMLFTGIMLTKPGPKTLEYNARFGDPETQTLFPLLRSDLAEIMIACTQQRLHEVEVEMEKKSCAVVVISAGGYPENYAQRDEISFKTGAVSEGISYFHAGTSFSENGDLVTAGRVIAVSATANTLEEAVKAAYVGVSRVSFEKMHFRKDIAYRAFR